MRGQARHTLASSKIFQKYCVDRYPQHDFGVHIYTWDHTSPHSEGTVKPLINRDKVWLKDHLNELYKPDSIAVGDNSHYKDIIVPFSQHVDWHPIVIFTVLNQIIASMRVQEQLYNYCEHYDYTPDLIVDTRTEMMNYATDGFWEHAYNTLNNNSNSVLAHKLREWDSYRYVGDFTFVYNMDTLKNMCIENSTTRLTSALYSESNFKMMCPKTRKAEGKTYWMSHTLYPSIVHKLQNYINMEIQDVNGMHSTAINNPCPQHEIFELSPNGNSYFDYCDQQTFEYTGQHEPEYIEQLHAQLLQKL